MSDPHLGWFRVEEAAVRKLRDTYDRQSAYRLALTVYVTLCRVSNLEGAETFTRSISSIGQDAGLSYNAAAQGLELVKSAGLVGITGKTVAGSKERAPSEYHLVRMFPTEWATSPTEKGRLPKSRNSRVLPRFPKNVSKNFPNQHDFKKSSTSSDDDDHAFKETLKAKSISEEMRQFLIWFDQFARSNGHALLPITRYTEELVNALAPWEYGSFEDIRNSIVEAVNNFDGPSDKRLTLVRICHDSR